MAPEVRISGFSQTSTPEEKTFVGEYKTDLIENIKAVVTGAKVF